MSAVVPHVLPLADCTVEPAARIGGKALGLCRLLALGCDVPAGFVVTTDAYRRWLSGSGLEAAPVHEMRALIEAATPPEELAAEIASAYARLGEEEGDEVPVAVRSSATAEDLEGASFAGQQETYLGVRGAEAVVGHAVRCWGSLFTPHAIDYRRRLGIPAEGAAMAVLVQRLVDARVAGVMLTVDPVNGDRSQIAIEAVLGLGLPLVGGELTPDRWRVDKVTLEIRSRAVARQPFADRWDAAAGGVRRVELAGPEGEASGLTDGEVRRLAEAGKALERGMGGAVDVEWAIGPGPDGPRHLYLLQARPETVWRGRRATPIARPDQAAMDRIVAAMLGKRSQR